MLCLKMKQETVLLSTAFEWMVLLMRDQVMRKSSSGGLGTTSSDVKWQPFVSTRSGSSYLNRVELQNGGPSLTHSSTFIPSTLAGSCVDLDRSN